MHYKKEGDFIAEKKFGVVESVAILICHKVFGYSKLNLAEMFNAHRNTIMNAVNIFAVTVEDETLVEGIPQDKVKLKAHEFLRKKNIHISPTKLRKLNIVALDEIDIDNIEKKLIEEFQIPILNLDGLIEHLMRLEPFLERFRLEDFQLQVNVESLEFVESIFEQLSAQVNVEPLRLLIQALEQIMAQIDFEGFVNALMPLVQVSEQLKEKPPSDYVEIFSINISKMPASKLKELSDCIENFDIENEIIMVSEKRETELLFANNNKYSDLKAYPNARYTLLSVRSASGKDSIEKIIKFFKEVFDGIEII